MQSWHSEIEERMGALEERGKQRAPQSRSWDSDPAWMSEVRAPACKNKPQWQISLIVTVILCISIASVIKDLHISSQNKLFPSCYHICVFVSTEKLQTQLNLWQSRNRENTSPGYKDFYQQDIILDIQNLFTKSHSQSCIKPELISKTCFHLDSK